MGPFAPNTINFPPLESIIISDICHFPLYKSKSFLQQKYVEERLSITEISRQIFSARSTVVRHLESFGIAIRKNDRTRKGGLPAYGRRRLNCADTDHKREQETIAKVITLRQQGHSYQKIVDILNAMGVPTKTKKAKWYAKTVRSIVIRRM